MIMMRIFLPLPTSRPWVAVTAGLGVALIASCGVDERGLGSMPFLPHDASVPEVPSSGAAGASGNPGTAGRGGSGGTVAGVAGAAGATAGTTGGATAGSVGTAGTGGAANAGTAGGGAAGGTSAGTAGASGGTGGIDVTGTAGDGAGGVTGAGGDTGSGGSVGTAGTVGTAGMGGTIGAAGAAGAAGMAGTAGMGGAGPGGTTGGRGGTGGGGNCNSFNCTDGCCANGVCVRQRSASQCGSNGQTCTPCGGCQQCSATGQCRIEPSSRWTIIAVSAQLDNSGWDRFSGELGGTAPDPFCEFENPAGQVSETTAGVTDTLIDTYNPNWNQVISPPGMTVSAMTLMANNPTWQIWVGDDDGCSGGTNCLGEVACTIRQPITETNLRSGQLIVNNRQNCNSVTINFVCQPTPASDEAQMSEAP
jgi:hypothetical protein